MKINDAKQIPLAALIHFLGGRHSHTDRKGDMWYFSPFRPDEKTASFKVNTEKNTWHDFGLSNTFAHHKQGSGGDILDLWCDYHLKDRRLCIKEALEGLSHLTSSSIQDYPQNKPVYKERQATKSSQPRYKLLKASNKITHFGLLDELSRRGISLALAKEYLQQGQILDTETRKIYYAFIFENDLGGFEVSIPNPSSNSTFKTCIGNKAITRILVSDDKNSADVFEGFWDFLTWLQMKGVIRPINHSYILNSVSLVSEACEKIGAFNEVIGYVFLFMDNDNAGYQATHAIAAQLEENNIKVASMEYLYDGYKDLSDFRMKIKPV